MIKLRLATIEDAQFLYDLRNEKSNRIMFHDTSTVKWEDHVHWLADKLSQTDFVIYIALNEEGDKIGQFRIDAKGEVSVSLADKFKGGGLGVEIIQIGSENFRKRAPVELIADVKIENIPSLKSFQKAGYRIKEKFTVDNQEYCRLVF